MNTQQKAPKPYTAVELARFIWQRVEVKESCTDHANRMAVLLVDNHYVIKYTGRSENRYWPEIFNDIYQEFGSGPFTHIQQTKPILEAC